MHKKLIEVALPLDAINKASAREKSIRHGHPSTLHLWWARRPLAAARAVIFAQMVDDPSSWPEEFPTEAAQEAERQRLFRLIEQLVLWENTTNEDLLEQARNEIRRSWRRTCAEHQDHPQATELFDPERLPAFHDPFAGGGSLPLEAQRLGMEAHASDLNPVAVLINKAMIEIPPKFAGMPPVNPEARAQMAKNRELGMEREWKGAEGLAEDVRYYGRWMRDEAEKRIGHLYPKVEVTEEMAKERPDLEHYVGRRLMVIAWLWARTVKSPNPAFRDVDVPLATTFMLSTKKGREVYVEPLKFRHHWCLRVRLGKPQDPVIRQGTKVGRATFRCLMSDTPISADYIRSEGAVGRIGATLVTTVVQSDEGGSRMYLDPLPAHEQLARTAEPAWSPTVEFFPKALGFRIGRYGLSLWSELATSRQLSLISTLCTLVREVRAKIETHRPCRPSYSDAIATYLGLAVSRYADYQTSFGRWQVGSEGFSGMYSRQAIPMMWDYPEINPFSDRGGSFSNLFARTAEPIAALRTHPPGIATHSDATTRSEVKGMVISTDPPYYDNIGYADLSDFFYVWLRHCLRDVFSDLFATVTVPKSEELVATPARHGGKAEAEAFFMNGMRRAVESVDLRSHSAFPMTIYYAFKQVEVQDEGGRTSTGWETFLGALVNSGFSVTGTLPLNAERSNRMRGIDSNALATNIVLVCRKRPEDAPRATFRQFINALKTELPTALARLRSGGIAPVDLAQAAIGPGMAVYTRYAKVVDATGEAVTVREALTLINQTLDECLSAQEGDFDADTRWALAWFEQHGFEDGDYGDAETLSKAKNTSIASLQAIGILQSKAGKVALLIPLDLQQDWDPRSAGRVSAWLTLHHLIRVHDAGGEQAAAALVRDLGGVAETARELAYRLYAIAERAKRAREALWYNALVQSWPEIARLAREERREQASLLEPSTA